MARNDSWIVAAASRSYYADLLGAGVNIHEYVAKSNVVTPAEVARWPAAHRIWNNTIAILGPVL